MNHLIFVFRFSKCRVKILILRIGLDFLLFLFFFRNIKVSLLGGLLKLGRIL